MKLEEKSKETKNAILDAAIIIFSTKNYEQTGVDEICDKAGITKGAFYHHFNSKQDLLLELLNQWMERIGQLLEETSQQSGDFSQILINLPGKIKPIFINELNQISIFLQFYIKGIFDPGTSEIIKTSYNDYLDFFSGIFEKGVKQGIINKVDTKKMARILFALTVGLLIQGFIDPDGEDWEKLAIECIKYFVR
ncbi:MAG: TetR/AcrR family transcriptional regulator [Actinobacteria bacterium]|nr:TetR/AcrR family transcriptional regulator [Actinomycetota bacterium]